jgi:hypothetical protein
MSNHARAVKLAALGLVLVGGALWFSPPQPLVDWLSPDVPVATKEPEGSEAGSETPVEVATAINPLAEITKDQFAETLKRPLFNPGRAGRPDAPEPQPEPEPTVTEEEPPVDEGIQAADLSLLGIAGDQTDLIAMVRWAKTNQVYRLKRGQYLSELELVAIDLKGATLKKDEKVIELALFAKGRGVNGEGVTPASDDSADDSADEEDTSAAGEDDTADDEEFMEEEDTSVEEDTAAEEDAAAEEDSTDGSEEDPSATDGETFDNEADQEQ